MLFLVGSANAVSWDEFKENAKKDMAFLKRDKNIQEHVTNPTALQATQYVHVEHVEELVSLVDADAENKKKLVDLLGYESVCLKIDSEVYTIRKDSVELGNTGCEFTIKTDGKTFEDFLEATKNNDQERLNEIMSEGQIKIPIRVQLNVFRKCMSSDLC